MDGIVLYSIYRRFASMRPLGAERAASGAGIIFIIIIIINIIIIIIITSSRFIILCHSMVQHNAV